MNITSMRKWILASLASVMLFALVFAAMPVKAADTFDVTVVHGINGRSLGLSKELPVNITITDGSAVYYINDFTFKERFSASLPAGEYTITVFSQELGVNIPSMTLGPVEIPAGANLLIRANLAANKTPMLMVKAK